ncbi:MAG: WYL domain-containing protein [Lachnospiraceae bacterium]|nr:WYL domain-containing protein [Lachnospiraceae bacterium]
MSDFGELIKHIDKCRDYVRDFFVYGFKSRGDFPGKSARTYDDERRRIVSWLPEYVAEDFTEGGRSKNISLRIDQKKLHTNPLYRVWQTGSFTDRDLCLHFFLLKLLEKKTAAYSAAELTDLLMEVYGYEADLQSVRRKCNEYVEEGLLLVQKEGKTLRYRRGIRYRELPHAEELLDLIRCFQMDQPLGVVGDTILHTQNDKNEVYRVKHGFPAFTLEDEILLAILDAIRRKQKVQVRVQNNRRLPEESTRKSGFPVQIFVSSRSGRRFVCMYTETDTVRARTSGTAHFSCVRLDQIKEVTVLPETVPEDKDLGQMLASLQPHVWGVSFAPWVPGRGQFQKLVLTIHADEKTEAYIMQRLVREGEGGNTEKISSDTIRYEKTVKDVMEMFPWIRSFIGRIEKLQIYGTDGVQVFEENETLEKMFFADLQRMYQAYDV